MVMYILLDHFYILRNDPHMGGWMDEWMDGCLDGWMNIISVICRKRLVETVSL